MPIRGSGGRNYRRGARRNSSVERRTVNPDVCYGNRGSHRAALERNWWSGQFRKDHLHLRDVDAADAEAHCVSTGIARLSFYRRLMVVGVMLRMDGL